jgi:hypothetical protein
VGHRRRALERRRLELTTEDRGLGFQTREIRPTTAVTRLEAGTGKLRPWKDIPEIGPDVSGVGEYTTTLHLDDDPREGYRYVLDLGSTAGGLGHVRVNVRRQRASTPQCQLSTLPRTCAPATTR